MYSLHVRIITTCVFYFTDVSEDEGESTDNNSMASDYEQTEGM